MSDNGINKSLQEAQSDMDTNVNAFVEDLPDDVENLHQEPEQKCIVDNDEQRGRNTTGIKGKKRKIPYMTIIITVVMATLGGAAAYLNKDLFLQDEQLSGYTFSSFKLSNPEQQNNNNDIQITYATKGELLSLASSLREENERYSRSILNNALSPISDKLLSFETRLRLISDKQQDLNVAFGELSATTPEDFSSFQVDIDELKIKSTALNNEMKEMLSEAKITAELAKALKENEWGIHTRLKKVEKRYTNNPVKIAKKTTGAKVSKQGSRPKIKTKAIPSAQKVKWVNKHPWKLKVSSNSFTQILNVQTNQLLRIYDGVDVTGCGLVTNINVEARNVSTQYCQITRSSNY